MARGVDVASAPDPVVVRNPEEDLVSISAGEIRVRFRSGESDLRRRQISKNPSLRLDGVREILALKAEGKTPYLLAVEVLEAGGAEMTRRNLWTFKAAKLFYNGGAIVQFILYDKTGRVVKSGVKSGKTPWVRLRPGKKADVDPGGTVAIE